MLKLNDRSTAVATVQEWLNFLSYHFKRANGSVEPLKVDGHYGEKTEAVVFDFQESMGLYADGVVGPQTMKALQEAYLKRVSELSSVDTDFAPTTPSRYWLQRVNADAFDGGYGYLSLRNDAAAAYNQVRQSVLSAGGLLTSSGGMRDLNAEVTSSRSPVSFHYVGLALDLYIYSGMVDPAKDPYVIQREENSNLHRVYARCSKNWKPNPLDKVSDVTLPEKREIRNAITYNQRNGAKNKRVEGNFLDLTDLFALHGYKRISARKGFYLGTSGMMAAEWWHFQFEQNLVRSQSTFGEELLKIFPETRVKSTPPWIERNRVFGVNWV